MKRLLLIGLVILAKCHPLPAQVVAVQHTEYKTWFDTQKHTPIYVKWTLTEKMLPKVHLPRTNRFIADPSIPNTNLSKDYAGSGYDQGHQMPAEDAASDHQSEVECFYFSNMEKQRPELNRVTWKALEVWCRKEVTSKHVALTIVCGGIGWTQPGPDHVAVPAYCWKAVLENGKWYAWIMPNVRSVKTKPFTAYATTMQDLDKKVGVRIESLK